MQDDNYSQSALKTACYRAYHSQWDNPRIFDDYLAPDFIGENELMAFNTEMIAGFKSAAPEMAAGFPNDAAILSFMMQAMGTPALTLSRAAYAEEKLHAGLQQGIKQYVILGAGMDTFAFRYPKLLEMLQVFEVDHPGTQKCKRRRLNELGWEFPSGLHFIPADLARASLDETLLCSRYNPQLPGFFNWLGVTYYLSKEAVLETLQSLAQISPPGSTMVFDYLDTDLLIPEKSAPRARQILLLAEQIGEPIQALFDPVKLARDLAGVGFRLVENLSPAEINGRYFRARNDKYYACENAHFACAVVD